MCHGYVYTVYICIRHWTPNIRARVPSCSLRLAAVSCRCSLNQEVLVRCTRLKLMTFNELYMGTDRESARCSHCSLHSLPNHVRKHRSDSRIDDCEHGSHVCGPHRGLHGRKRYVSYGHPSPSCSYMRVLCASSSTGCI